MFNPVTTATAGWSEAVESRAQRLLSYSAGWEPEGPLDVGRLFERSGLDPVMTARLLMTVPPLDAVDALARIVAGCRIDGDVCPDPLAFSRDALSAAGRAVAREELHPERVLLAGLWCAGRRLLSRVLRTGRS